MWFHKNFKVAVKQCEVIVLYYVHNNPMFATSLVLIKNASPTISYCSMWSETYIENRACSSDRLKFFVETLNAFMAEGYYTSMINMRSFCVFHTLMQLSKETYFVGLRINFSWDASVLPLEDIKSSAFSCRIYHFG